MCKEPFTIYIYKRTTLPYQVPPNLKNILLTQFCGKYKKGLFLKKLLKSL